MTDTTTVTPEQAAAALSITPFALARYLREEAARDLTSLAGDIERGGESNRGDVSATEFGDRCDAAWRLVESAQACDAVWQREEAE